MPHPPNAFLTATRGIMYLFINADRNRDSELERSHMRTFWIGSQSLVKGTAAIALAVIGASTASANLLQNGSFEVADNTWQVVSGGGNNQAIWNDNNDGWGLYRDSYTDFTGVSAEDGHHWAAALNYAGDPGAFGQLLGTTLQAGQSYSVDGWFHQSVRIDLDFSGGYDVLINNTASLTGAEFLGHLGDTSGDTSWQHFANTFVAPTDAASMPYFIFEVTGGNNAYIALDNLNLAPTNGAPEPCTMVLLFGGAAALLRRRKLS